MNDEPLIQLVERLQIYCMDRGMTAATAESCTGGLVAKLITDVAGSSGYFHGGIVSYSNESKQGFLGGPAAEPGLYLPAGGNALKRRQVVDREL